MTALEERAVQGEVVTPPEPIMQGTFAVYERKDGSMVLAYATSEGLEGRRVFPAAMVKMGMKMAARAAAKAEAAAED